MKQIRNKRFMLSLITLILGFSLLFTGITGIVYAGSNITTVSYWDSLASQLVVSDSGITTADALAKRLSEAAGGSTYSDGGTAYAQIIVGVGANYYTNGVSSIEVPDATKYTALALSAVTNSGGTAITGVSVYYYTAATASSLSKITSNVSSNLLAQSGVTPDTGTALLLFSGIKSPVNVFLGIIVIIISTGMTVFSALDIIYLAFPAFRGKIDNQIESGGKTTKTNSDGSVSSRLVSDDARLAMEEAMQNQIQPWKGYFKRRLGAYIFLSVVLFIFMTGNIFVLTSLVTNLLGGLFKALGLS